MTIEWVGIIVFQTVNINHTAIGLNLTTNCRLTLPGLEVLQLHSSLLCTCVWSMYISWHDMCWSGLVELQICQTYWSNASEPTWRSFLHWDIYNTLWWTILLHAPHYQVEVALLCTHVQVLPYEFCRFFNFDDCFIKCYCGLAFWE